MMKSRSGGFTLIELLAVITIMGILMLVAIPAISRTIENSRKDTFVNTAKQYANSAKTMWNGDNLSCSTAEGSFNSSTMPAGDYYIEINTDADANVPVLLEQGGKSSWGNRDIKGYVKVVVTETTGVYGDIDGDGVITTTDCTTVRSYINSGTYEWSAFEKKKIDVNGDGEITLSDYHLIRQRERNLIHFFPVAPNATSFSYRDVNFYPVISDGVHGVNVEKSDSGDVGLAGTLTDSEELVRGNILMNDATYDTVVIPTGANMCVER